MDHYEVPARDAEQVWIAKYRSALDAAPIEQSPMQKLWNTLTSLCSVVTSSNVARVSAADRPVDPRAANKTKGHGGALDSAYTLRSR
jgi:hypothetical protein